MQQLFVTYCVVKALPSDLILPYFGLSLYLSNNEILYDAAHIAGFMYMIDKIQKSFYNDLIIWSVVKSLPRKSTYLVPYILGLFVLEYNEYYILLNSLQCVYLFFVFVKTCCFVNKDNTKVSDNTKASDKETSLDNTKVLDKKPVTDLNRRSWR